MHLEIKKAINIMQIDQNRIVCNIHHLTASFYTYENNILS